MTTPHDHAKRGDGQYPGSAEQRIARGEATMTAKPAPETINISKIGCTRTVQTAVLLHQVERMAAALGTTAKNLLKGIWW